MTIRLHSIVCAAAVLVLALVSQPAFAQADLSGIWQPRYDEDFPERIPGPELVDYLGLPINDAARQFAETWDPSRITLPEEQCRVHVSPYIFRGPLNLRIWDEKDPKTQQLIAIKQYISTYEQTRTIYMDGRPHPDKNAKHTWMGFSTGHWEGDMLVVETDHIKQGWVRRNGLPMSDQAHMTEYYARHGDILTHIFVLVDPVYLAEPLVKSEDFVRSERELPAQTWLWVCEPVVEIADRPAGEVPAYMPGENPFLDEFSRRHGIPMVAALGGPQTMYPEFEKVVESAPKPKPLPPPQRGSERIGEPPPAAPPAAAPKGGR
ncbi:MAG TPA: hypothetical protein VG871_18000 [Vicinamibacterales bacterium]|nr:hypothetical protein [Vicinamibacterales bacterium]